MAVRRPISPSPWTDAGWLAAIGLCGAVVRLAFAWQYTRQPLGRYTWVDEASYWTWAGSILKAGWWPMGPFYQDPLYPYWLACLMGVVGSDVVVLRMTSAGVGALTPLFVAWAGRIGLGRAEGLVAGWATALYGPLIFADGCLEKEGLATLCTAISLGLTAHLSRSGRLILAAAAGLSWGMVGLLRSNALILAPLGVIWLACGDIGPATAGPGRRWRPALAYLAGFLLALMPVAAVNTAVSNPRELLGTTWQLGPNFYIGNGPEATGTYVSPAFVRPHPAYEANDFAAEAMRRAGRPLSPGQISRFWLGEGLKQWARAPVASLRLLLRKAAFVTHRSEIPDSQDVEFVRIVAAPALRWGALGFGIVFPLAAVGLSRSPRDGFWWFLCLSTGLGLAATCLFFVVGRYRLPWVPGLILLAAAGVVDLARLARAGDWRGMGWRLGALGLPAMIVCWRPQADPAPARWGNQLILMGVAELRAGRLDRAIDAFDLARAASPATAANVRQQSIDGPLYDLLRGAIDAELAAIPGPGGGGPAAIRVARLLRQLRERSALARSLLESCLRLNPDDAEANREWAALLLAWPGSSDDRARALEALERAIPDRRAAMLASLVASDPRILDRASTAIDDDDPARLAVLVEAMLASAPRRSPAGGGSPRPQPAAEGP